MIGDEDQRVYIEGAVFEDGYRAIARALDHNFTSPNESDSNLEPANVVDGLYQIARSLGQIASAINDLTEAVEGADDE